MTTTTLVVKKLDCGFGPIDRAWVLLADGNPLMIGDHGCVAPTKAAAIAEAHARVADDIGYRFDS